MVKRPHSRRFRPGATAQSAPPETLVVQVTDLSRGGAGVARDESGRVIFVPLTAPGDRVRVRVIGAERRYAQGELLEVVDPSKLRVTPRCAAFGHCGGCQWQHLSYDLQWKTKAQGVLHALRRVGLEVAGLEELPATRIWEYRNRIQLRGEAGKLGFFARASRQLVPIERCEIARPELNAQWPALKEAATRFDGEYKAEVEVFEDGRVATSWNRGHAALGFRQVHDEQNDRLRAWVADAMTPGRRVLDLFGGQGNLSWPIVEQGRAVEVHCVDVSAPPARKASWPPSIQFHRSPVLPWLLRRQPDDLPWSAILDPPREGLAGDLTAITTELERLGVTELVAVGCDADAWARDLSRWARRGWRLERVGALDLFPQTPHVEALAVLRRGSARGFS